MSEQAQEFTQEHARSLEKRMVEQVIPTSFAVELPPNGAGGFRAPRMCQVREVRADGI
jgi:hypothetical protein